MEELSKEGRYVAQRADTLEKELEQQRLKMDEGRQDCLKRVS
jgi:hypothetical protein